MDYDDQAQLTSFVSGLLLGAVLGVGIALLTAPQSGPRTRKKLQRAAVDFREGAADRWDDLADDMKRRVDDTVRSARKRLPSR
jgi:gas vesicle protein